MRTKKTKGIVLAVAACLMFAACSSGGSTGPDGSQASSKLTIGTLEPMTGPASGFGTTSVAMMKEVLAATNKAGGVDIGGKNYTLALKVFDDENTPEVAQAVAREAINDGIGIIVGPLGSGAATAIKSVVANSDAVWLLHAATDPSLTQSANVFRTAPLTEAYDDAALSYLKSHPELKNVAMTTDQLHTGLVSSKAHFVKGVEALGRTVTSDLKHQPGDTDFRASLTKMKQQGADVLIMRGYPAEQVLFLTQARELLGDQIPVVWLSPVTRDEVAKLVPDEKIMGNTILASPRGDLDSFVSEGNKTAVTLAGELGKNTGGASTYTHDAFEILIAALTRANSTSKADLLKALTGLPVSSITGKTLNSYQPQAGGLVFKDREVSLSTEYRKWVNGKGWTAP